MSRNFLDTNVLLRYLTGDNESMAAAALNLLQRIESGHEVVITSPLVIFETVFTLQQFYRVDRELIRTLLTPIIVLDGLELEDKSVHLRALDIYVEVNVSFADAFNAAYMMARGLSEMYTWDRAVARIDGITQIEPRIGDQE